jgi:type II secretion system protein H
MRTSAPGCFEWACRRGNSGGFTLLEMLVALVIIAVAISTAIVALRPDPRGLVRQEGDRLAVLLGLASEESGVGGMPLAWVGREDGYEFQARELTDAGPEWVVVRGDDLLHPRQLPSGTHILSIQVDGEAAELGRRVPLGNQGTHELSVEIAVGEARARITGTAGRFQSTLAAGDGT